MGLEAGMKSGFEMQFINLLVFKVMVWLEFLGIYPEKKYIQLAGGPEKEP